jgi:hypothetical protein
MITQKKRGVNPSYYGLVQKTSSFQTSLLNVFGSKTNTYTLYMLVGSKQVVCYPYPYHRSDMCSFPLLIQQ